MIIHQKNRIIIALLLLQFSVISYSQIIADHTVVDRYDDIPQQWIDSVKTMWLSYAGESHSRAIRNGLLALETSDATYAVSVTESGTPESPTTSNLRASRATWGDLTHSTGWIYSYGEEDWFTTSTAISRTKDGITYATNNGFDLSAFGFGWCWDTTIDSPAEFKDYIDATKECIAYCSDSIQTTVFFTTGTTDTYDGEIGYNKYIGYEQIRDSVAADNSRVLFDYADILCYDNGSEVPNTTTWDGHTYPWITTTNLSPEAYSSHISATGALRLAKAMWWMLARVAGWDGGVTDIEDDPSSVAKTRTAVKGDELMVFIPDNMVYDRVDLYSIDGSLKASRRNDSDFISFNISALASGLYILVVQHALGADSKKIILH